MLKSGRTTFSKIAGLVNRPGSGHEITSHIGNLREKREKRLESLGVRPLNEQGANFEDLPESQRKVYEEAYKALKKSRKSWATDTEIRDILFTDKEMTHDRSSEVIEILREADVAGFKETDDVTPGDIYSERVLGVINKQAKKKQTEARRDRMKQLMDQDRGVVGGGGDVATTEKGKSFGSMRIVKLQSSDSPPEPYGGQAHIAVNRPRAAGPTYNEDTADDDPQRHIPLPHERPKNEVALPTAAEKLFARDRSPRKKEEKKTPLAFGIEDSDLNTGKEPDDSEDEL